MNNFMKSAFSLTIFLFTSTLIIKHKERLLMHAMSDLRVLRHV